MTTPTTEATIAERVAERLDANDSYNMYIAHTLSRTEEWLIDYDRSYSAEADAEIAILDAWEIN